MRRRVMIPVNNNHELAGAVSRFIDKLGNENPHLSGGLSRHGSCLGKQVADHFYPHEFKYGFMTPGTAFHAYIQFNLKSGSIFNDKFLIIGHEQYVRYLTNLKNERLSPIDTLPRNLISNAYEVWDWKTTSKDTRYVYEVDLKHFYQVNLYGERLRWQWRLEYHPICRVFYVNKANWNDIKEFNWTTDLSAAEDSKDYINTVEEKKRLKSLDEINKYEWGKLTHMGLNVFNKNRKPYRQECKNCDHKRRCLTKLGRADLLDDPKEGWLYDPHALDKPQANLDDLEGDY